MLINDPEQLLAEYMERARIGARILAISIASAVMLYVAGIIAPGLYDLWPLLSPLLLASAVIGGFFSYTYGSRLQRLKFAILLCREVEGGTRACSYFIGRRVVAATLLKSYIVLNVGRGYADIAVCKVGREHGELLVSARPKAIDRRGRELRGPDGAFAVLRRSRMDRSGSLKGVNCMNIALRSLRSVRGLVEVLKKSVDLATKNL
ncbi:MAG: hypothetical protein DRO39_04630 [Thermoprotei archaeon]|nr:MAG: hypothetical protein DRO39_04630 [Thermoprotei archaeon]